MSGFFSRMGERARGSEAALGLRPAQPFEPAGEEGPGELESGELEDGLELTMSGGEAAAGPGAGGGGSEATAEPQPEPPPAEPASADANDAAPAAPATHNPPPAPPAEPEKAPPVVARGEAEEQQRHAPAAPEPSPPSPPPPPLAPAAEPVIRSRAGRRRPQRSALRTAAPTGQAAAPRPSSPRPKPAAAPEPRFDLATLLRDHVVPALADQGLVDREERPAPAPAEGAPSPLPGEIIVEPADVTGLPAPSLGHHPASDGPAAVNVQIGRVTVTRAPAPPPPPAPPRRAAPRATVDHDGYLARRREQR